MMSESKLCKYCKMQIPKIFFKNQRNIFIVTIFLLLMSGCGYYSNDTESLEESKRDITFKTSTSSESYSTDIKESIPEVQEDTLEFTYEKMDVKFIESKIEEDASGQTCLVLYFDFTNNTDENKAFIYCFSATAFQNGVQIDHSYFHVNEETKNTDREIQPGTTIRVAENYVISNMDDEIQIEVEPFMSISENKLMEFSVDAKE